MSGSLGVVPLDIPLVKVAGGSTSRPVRPEATGSCVPDRARERIRFALLLGDIKRFERLVFPELVG